MVINLNLIPTHTQKNVKPQGYCLALLESAAIRLHRPYVEGRYWGRGEALLTHVGT